MSRTKIVTLASAVGLVAGAVVTLGVSRGVTTTPGSGVKQRVRVDGHWRIEIRDPDGTLASEHEFHNRFDGAVWLGKMLAREISAGRYEIQLREAGAVPRICGDDTNCRIREFQSVYSGVDPNKNLRVSSSPSAPLKLSGSATATASTNINHVSVYMYVCASAAPGCGSTVLDPSPVPMSSHALPQLIDVVNGQQIQVTVTFTFPST